MRLRKMLMVITCISLIGINIAGCNSKKNTSTNADEQTTEDEKDTSDIQKFDIEPEYTDEEIRTDYDVNQAVEIKLSKNKIESQSGNVTINNTEATITTSGTYIISGEIENGNIVVNSKSDDPVRIILDNASITSSNTAPIYVKNAKETIITIKDGTTNKLTDSKRDDSENEENINAVIYSKDDLTINGTGKLEITALENHGIQSKDNLKIINGCISVNSVGDGIVGKDAVIIKEGSITIESEADGIKSTEAKQDKGYIYLDDPTITIHSKKDGIQAMTCLYVKDGNYEIVSNGGSENATVKTDNMPWNEQNSDMGQAPQNMQNGTSGEAPQDMQDGTSGEPPQDMQNGTPPELPQDMQDGTFPERPQNMPQSGNNNDMKDQHTSASDQDETESESAKGMKAGVDITIKGGKMNINTSDDGVHSNNTVTVEGGELQIAAGDDGIHADETLTINNGTINITTSYEGLEGGDIVVNDGNVSIVSSDDGFNASGGTHAQSTNSTENKQQGKQGMDDATDNTLTINGGTIKVNASGDGLDSNGLITMNGGDVYVDGPTNGGNGSLDYGSEFVMKKGNLIATGSLGMAVGPTESSTQYSVNAGLTNSYVGGTEIVVKDSTGNEVIRYTPSKQFQSFIFSSEKLKSNETYTIYANGTEDSTFTISDVITTVGENTGNTFGGGKGGMFGGKNKPNQGNYQNDTTKQTS